MRITITRMIRDLEASVQRLRKLQRYSYKEIEDDIEKFWAIEHGLQISIQSIIDIGNHIAAEIGENEIEEYADILNILEKHNVLPLEFAENIRGMIGFRNLLVHRYGDVDVKIVYDILQNRLYDFERFIGYIQSYFDGE
jgi:uncharacterized protein YutE (UPF0331/DUF86 family)